MSDTALADATAGTARRFRGPFTRWPRGSDAALAVAAFLATVFLVDGPGDSIVVRPVDDVPAGVLLALAAGAAALYWRRRAPMVVLALEVVGWAALLIFVDADIEAHLGLMAIIVLYSVGRYTAPQWWGPAGVAVVIVFINLDGLRNPAPWWEDAVFGAVFASGAWYVGRRLRLRSERALQLRRERAAENRRIVTEERARIARELHDVVAHRVSLMTVQAGAAKSVVINDPDAARNSMAAVEEAGREALSELRDLLGVLRPDADPDDLGPQPGLTNLPQLAEQFGSAGLDVSLTTDGVPELADRVDLFAYRIVQEALTNALKHAGRGARAEVRLNPGADGIIVEVLDNGRDVAPDDAGAAVAESGGHGIVGMRERALLLGGTLDAGPRPGGGFRVVAYLPTGEEKA